MSHDAQVALSAVLRSLAVLVAERLEAMLAELMPCVRYIISVIQITDIGEGVIVPGTGQARFKCRYTAVVMKPFKGETVDGKVVNVNKMGFFAMVGPLQVFVSSHVSCEFGHT